MTMIKDNPDEIWFWYQHVEGFKTSDMRPKQYCETHKLDYKKFHRMRYRINGGYKSSPERYKHYVKLTRQCMESDISRALFASQNNIPLAVLTEMIAHVGYLNAIEKAKLKRGGARTGGEPKSFQFVQVPVLPVSNGGKLVPISPPQEAEVIEKQNDIEIVITKGVKVIISPIIDSMKIIKIIELLKDL